MKMLFIISVLSSLGYLIYQESPAVARWVNAAPVSEVKLPSMSAMRSGVEEGVETVKHAVEGLRNKEAKEVAKDLQQELDALKADYAVLKEQLMDPDDAWLRNRQQNHQQNHQQSNHPYSQESTMNPTETITQSSVLSGTRSSMESMSQRREDLIQLAERMEMHALGLVGQ